MNGRSAIKEVMGLESVISRNPVKGWVITLSPNGGIPAIVGRGPTEDAAAEEAMSLLESEKLAKALIESQGLEYCPEHHPEHPEPNLRYGYTIPNTWDIKNGGNAKGWGSTPLKAANALMGVHFLDLGTGTEH